MAGTGLMRLASGDEARARSLFEQGLALGRRTGDKFAIAVAAGALGHGARCVGCTRVTAAGTG